jgi:hypothetical protein
MVKRTKYTAVQAIAAGSIYMPVRKWQTLFDQHLATFAYQNIKPPNIENSIF